MDIRLEHITKYFNHKIAIDNVSITFEEGRINCLMGASGAGKTTLMNLIMGLVKPDSGEIQGMKGKRVAAVFQEDRLIEHWDAVKNIRLVCEKDISPEQIARELDKLGLYESKDKPVRDYSGGMRRRGAILRAMFSKNDILLMDEPFKGLDYDLKKQVIEYIKQNTQGKTVIIVTHDKEDVGLLAAELVTLR
jgi:NitT/TauT family transport system ATP-binding protein